MTIANCFVFSSIKILRLDFVADQKRWEAELARTAPEVMPEAEYEDEMEMGGQGNVFARNKPKQQDNKISKNYSMHDFSHTDDIPYPFSPLHHQYHTRQEQEREEAEMIAQRERQELEALVALMEDQQQQQRQQQQQKMTQQVSKQMQRSENDVDIDVDVNVDDDDLDGLLMGYASSKEIGNMTVLGQDQGQSQGQGHDQNQGDGQGDEMDVSMG